MKRSLLFFLAAFCWMPDAVCKAHRSDRLFRGRPVFVILRFPRINGYLARLGAKHEINVST